LPNKNTTKKRTCKTGKTSQRRKEEHGESVNPFDTERISIEMNPKKSNPIGRYKSTRETFQEREPYT